MTIQGGRYKVSRKKSENYTSQIQKEGGKSEKWIVKLPIILSYLL